jgi:O-antigen ligase
MKALLQRNKDYFAYLGLMMIVLGLPLSRAMMSIGMAILVILSMFQPNYNVKLMRFLQLPPFIAITAFYLLVVISGLWSEDFPAYLNAIRIKLPFLLLPLSLYVLMPISEKALFIILKTFFWLIVISSFWSVFYLLMNYTEITASYAYGKVLFTPTNHIRFSLMVVMALVVGYYLLKNNFLEHSWKRKILFVAMIYLVAFLHVLAVRSGLLAFYTAATVFAMMYAIERKSYVVIGTAFVIIAAIITLSINLSPTLNMKYRYTKYELQNYFGGNYNIVGSDVRRLLSIRSGIEVGNDNKLLGVGYGDVKSETQKQYDKLFPQIPEENKKLPHNQFVYVYAALGIIGVLLFLASFFLPLFYRGAWKNILIMGISIITFTSFFSEYTFETQVGVTFYTLFLLVPFCIHLQQPVLKTSK